MAPVSRTLQVALRLSGVRREPFAAFWDTRVGKVDFEGSTASLVVLGLRCIWLTQFICLAYIWILPSSRLLVSNMSQMALTLPPRVSDTVVTARLPKFCRLARAKAPRDRRDHGVAVARYTDVPFVVESQMGGPYFKTHTDARMVPFTQPYGNICGMDSGRLANLGLMFQLTMMLLVLPPTRTAAFSK